MKNSTQTPVLTFDVDGINYDLILVREERFDNGLGGGAPWNRNKTYTSVTAKVYRDGEYVCNGVYNKKYPQMSIRQMSEWLKK